MAYKERGSQSEQGQPPEGQPELYHRVARFRDARAAGWSYSAAQEAILHSQCDLSVLRLILRQR